MPVVITLGNLTVDRARFEASVDGRRVDLTYVEFELLYTLARNAGRAVSRDRLSAAIWREPADGTRRLTVHISRLRKKLERMAPWAIETITKRGYILTQVTEEAPEPPLSRRRRLRPAGAAP